MKSHLPVARRFLHVKIEQIFYRIRITARFRPATTSSSVPSFTASTPSSICAAIEIDLSFIHHFTTSLPKAHLSPVSSCECHQITIRHQHPLFRAQLKPHRVVKTGKTSRRRKRFDPRSQSHRGKHLIYASFPADRIRSRAIRSISNSGELHPHRWVMPRHYKTLGPNNRVPSAATIIPTNTTTNQNLRTGNANRRRGFIISFSNQSSNRQSASFAAHIITNH